MSSRRKSSVWVVAGLTVLFAVAVSVAPVFADGAADETDPAASAPKPLQAQRATSERLYEASLNWADYVSEPTGVTARSSMGERLYEASLNWADYVSTPARVTARSSMGERLYRASLNRADYAVSSAGVTHRNKR